MNNLVVTDFITDDYKKSNKLLFLPYDNIVVDDNVISISVKKKNIGYLFTLFKVVVGKKSINLDKFLKENNNVLITSNVYNTIDLYNDSFIYYENNDSKYIIGRYNKDDILVSSNEKLKEVLDNLNKSIITKIKIKG